MTLPTNLDDATRFLSDISPEQWSLFRLGLGTVLVAVVVAGFVIWVLLSLARRP